MTPVANIDGYPPKLCLEHSVSRVSLHVICGLSLEQRDHLASRVGSGDAAQTRRLNLIEVPNPGNVVLPALSQHISRVGNHHSGVPQRAVQRVSLQDRRDDDHVVFFGQLAKGATVLMSCCPARCRTSARLSPHLLTEPSRVPFFGRLRKLRPRFFFTGAESKGHGCREQKMPFYWWCNFTNVTGSVFLK